MISQIKEYLKQISRKKSGFIGIFLIISAIFMSLAFGLLYLISERSEMLLEIFGIHISEEFSAFAGTFLYLVDFLIYFYSFGALFVGKGIYSHHKEKKTYSPILRPLLLQLAPPNYFGEPTLDDYKTWIYNDPDIKERVTNPSHTNRFLTIQPGGGGKTTQALAVSYHSTKDGSLRPYINDYYSAARIQ